MRKIFPVLAIALFYFSCNQTAKKFYNAGIEKLQRKTNVGDSVANEAARQANLKAALKDFDKAIENDSQYLEAYEMRGQTKRALGDFTGCIADAEKVATLKPGSAPVYSFIGRTRDEVKDYAGAVKAFSRAIDIDQQDANNYYLRGMAEEELHDNNSALKDLKQAVTISPNGPSSVNFYSSLGLLKLDLNDKSGCIDLAKAKALGDQNVQDLIDERCK